MPYQYYRGGYKNIEVVVINDGSIDGTERIVKEYQVKDKRVVLINQTNHGVGYAKSIGIRSCTGDYIAFCDSDDWYDEDYLQEHYKHIAAYDADISQCRTFITTSVDAGNSDKIEVLDDDLVKKYVSYQSITVSLWDKLYKRNVLNSEEVFTDCRSAEDLYMNYVASKRAKRIVKFDTTKYNWYVNPDSLSRSIFKPERLESDFASWGRIIGDCAKNYPELEETARLSSELWICGTYRAMVNSHYHDKKLEKKIASYIRQDGLQKTLNAEHNKANKRFIRLALISMPLARYTWYIIRFGKNCAKKILRR